MTSRDILFGAANSGGGTNVTPITTWTQQANGATDAAMYGAAASPTTIVAVGNNGAVATSSDGGNTWVKQNSGTTQTLNAVAWSPALGLFVVAASSGFVFTSPNGADWSPSTTPASSTNSILYSIAWSPTLNIFVAVGADGFIISSADGVSWGTVARFGSAVLRGITWDGSAFFIINTSSDSDIITSTDGVNWQYRYSDGWFNGLGTSGTRYVAVRNSGQLLTSTNNTDWFLSTNTNTSKLNDVTYAAGLFVAVGQSNSLVSANNGVSWVTRTLGGDHTAVTYGAGLFVAVNTSGGISTTPEGLVWTARTSGTSSPLYDITYASTLGLFVAVGSGVILTSPDGITWTTTVNLRTTNTEFLSVNWNGFTLTALSSQFTVYSSGDGLVWKVETTSRTMRGLAWSPTLSRLIWNGSNYTTYYGNNAQGLLLNSRPVNTGTDVYRTAWSSSLNLFVSVGDLSKIYYSADGITWTTVTVAGSFSFQDVVWSGSLFVAVGASGNIYTSADGVTWTQRTSGTTNIFYAVTWSSSLGLFIAVGDVSTVRTSPDGITWTTRTLPASNTLRTVAWGSGLFVIGTSSSTTYYTSPDGITWTQRTITTTGGISTALIFDGTRFVGGGAASNKIVQSTNGTTWTDVDTPLSSASPVVSIVYTGTTYYVSNGYASIASSTDLITWAQELTGDPLLTTGNHAIYSDGSVYIACTYNASTGVPIIVTSPDRKTWTQRYGAPSNRGSFRAINKLGSRYTVVGQSGYFLSSTDAVTWTPSFDIPTFSLQGYAVAYSPSLNTHLAVGTTGSGYLTSTTGGTSWIESQYDVTAGNSKYTAIWHNPSSSFLVGGNSGTIISTTNGYTWTQRTSKTSYAVNGLLYASTQNVVAAVASTGTILTSATGATWTKRNSAGIMYSHVPAYAPALNLTVVCGEDGNVYSSSDLETWTHRYPGDAYPYYGITWSPTLGIFVIVGGNPSDVKIRTSADGITWTLRSAGTTNLLNDVTWAPALGLFVAVGSGGVILTSPNGTTWTTRTSGTTQTITSVAWSPVAGRFAAVVSTSGLLLTSTDGITWASKYLGAFVSTATAVVYAGGYFYIVSASTESWVYRTVDGTTLEYVTSSNSFQSSGVSSSYIFTGTDLCIALFSTDGVTWRVEPLVDNTFNVTGLHWTGSLYLAGTNGSRIYTSPDSFNWTRRNVSITTVNDFANSPSIIVAVGSSGQISTSTDAVTWTARTSGTTSTLNAVIWDGAKFITAGTAGNIRSSTDGITWTLTNTGATFDSYDIAWNGSTYVVVGAASSDPRIATSTDGVTWTLRTVPAGINNPLYGVTWSSALGLFVAVSGASTTNNSITSPDGITWTLRTTPHTGTLWTVEAFGADIYAFDITEGGILKSSNAINYTFIKNELLPVPGSYRSVTYTTLEYVYVGARNTTEANIVVTTDNIVGTNQSSSAFPRLNGVNFVTALDAAVAVGNNGAILLGE